MQNNNWLFIANPYAGRGKTAKKLLTIENKLNKLRFNYQLQITKKKNHAQKIVNNFINKGYQNIVAIGGDGTANEVVNGIIKSGNLSKISFGIIPTGGGNDFCRNFDFSSNLAENISRLYNYKRKKIDIGMLNNYYFLNVLGIGFDAEIANTAQKIKYLNGLPRYLLALFKQILKLKYYPLLIDVNDKRYSGEFLLLSIGNGRYSGGGFQLTPRAVPDDGLLDFCLVRKVKKTMILRLLHKVIKGNHLDVDEVTYFTAKTLSIKTSVSNLSKIPIYFDGEIINLHNAKKIEIKIREKVLNFIV